MRDQILSQVQVAIASGDLRPGDRLPSTREIARRFGVHANTVSAAYRALHAIGLVALRKGSGVFVRDDDGDVLDAMLDLLFREAAEAGYGRQAVLDRVLRSTRRTPTENFFLYEPDPYLAEIVRFEVYEHAGIGLNVIRSRSDLPENSIIIALFDERPRIQEQFGDIECVYLRTTSVAASLAGRAKPTQEALVAVVSAWGDFLVFARLYLLAVGLQSHSILTVSARESGWKNRIRAATLVVSDTLIADQFRCDDRVVTFRLISDDSIQELRSLAQP